eukprot:1314857-Amorphochlora_amoeboformis.AAC.1
MLLVYQGAEDARGWEHCGSGKIYVRVRVRVRTATGLALAGMVFTSRACGKDTNVSSARIRHRIGLKLWLS